MGDDDATNEDAAADGREELIRAASRLAVRIDRLEAFALCTLAVIAAGGLIAGLLIPYATSSENGEPVTRSLLTMGFGGLAYRDEEGNVDSTSIVIGIAFLGLFLAALAALVALIGMAGRAVGRGLATAARIIAAILLAGAVGAWLLAATGTGSDDFVLHAGVFVFTAGVLVFAMLAYAGFARSWWEKA